MQSLIPYDGELYYFPEFIAAGQARDMHARLLNDLDWHGETIRIAGREVAVPRLVGWYGVPGIAYTYSGTRHTAQGWVPLLLELRDRLESCSGHHFNSVLANQYRDGRDSMGWHADKEPELGENPCIASLSFGETRRFLLRHNRTREVAEFELENGSLVLMAGCLQHHWRHCIPKTAHARGNRVNLTYRNIVS